MEMTIEVPLEITHYLDGYWLDEEKKIPKMHGHSYVAKVFLKSAEGVVQTAYVADEFALEDCGERLKSELDHIVMNHVVQTPTGEALARYTMAFFSMDEWVWSEKLVVTEVLITRPTRSIGVRFTRESALLEATGKTKTDLGRFPKWEEFCKYVQEAGLGEKELSDKTPNEYQLTKEQNAFIEASLN